MTIKRLDNILIVVDDLEAAKAFFLELGLELEGETTVEGSNVDRLIGLENVRATLALMRTPDPCELIVVSNFGKPEMKRRTQTVYCHAACLRQRADPSFPWDALDDED